MKPKILFFFFSAAFFLISATLCAEQRTWTDTAGRTMQAEFVRLDRTSDDVIFRNSAGKAYRFPLRQLGQKDRDYIMGLLKVQPSGKLSNPANSSQRQASKHTTKQTRFEQSLTKHLVRNINGQVKQVNGAGLGAKDYYAIYYSAHWCPPCKKFTPKLVNFYNSYSRKHDNFEIIFVSSDRGKAAMEKYITAAGMPWPALEFEQTNSNHPATNYSGNGIPCLVLIDNKGNVLANSYKGKKYVGPDVVMDVLRKKLDQQ